MTHPDNRSIDGSAAREESWAHLTVLSTALSPDELRSLVGVAPDESWRQGERGASPFNGFEVRSRLDRVQDPVAHISDLLDRLDASKVHALVTDARVDNVRFWVVINTNRWNPALSIPPEVLAALYSLGTGLEVDIYVDEFDSTVT